MDHVTLSSGMGPITIRPTSESDAAALRDLRLEALWMHPEAFSSDHETSAARPMEWWLDRARAGAGLDGGQVTFVAQPSADAPPRELIGMAGVYREEGCKVRHNAHLWGVYVRPAWRGLGVADALIDACESWSRCSGIRVLRLAVVTTNLAAVRCYQRRGFVPFGTAPEAIRHNGIFFEELLMAKHICADEA